MTRHLGPTTHCPEPVAWAGKVSFTRPKPNVVRAFACEAHKDALENPQPYGSNPEHVHEMNRRLQAEGAALFPDPPSE